MLLLVGLMACTQETTAPGSPPRMPVGLLWGSGASGAFVDDTVPLVVFYRDSVGDPIGLPHPTVIWASSSPAVLELIGDTLAAARDTGIAVLTAVSQSEPSYTIEVPFRVIASWQGRLVWARQLALGLQPGLAVQELPDHHVEQLPEIGYPGAGSSDPYLSSDGRYVAATGTRPTSPIANRTIFVVDLVTGDVQMPLDPLPGDQFSAVWFPGDSLLGFLMAATSGWEVFTSRPDGSGVLQRTQLGQAIPPLFDVTPENTLVLPLLVGPSSTDLFEVSLAGDVLRRLTSTAAYETMVAISPDGATIAYVSVTGGVNSVWVMDRDGSNPHPLLPAVNTIAGNRPKFSTQPAGTVSPSWTPDSRFVLLTWAIDPYLQADSSVYDVLGDLYAVRVVDGLAIRLTRRATADAQPFFR